MGSSGSSSGGNQYNSLDPIFFSDTALNIYIKKKSERIYIVFKLNTTGKFLEIYYHPNTKEVKEYKDRLFVCDFAQVL